MKKRSKAVLFLLLTLPPLANAQDAATSAAKTKPAAGHSEESGDAAAIRAATAAFVEAFNKKDSKAVVEFWALEGEYIDEDGEIVKGRSAIAERYNEFFKEMPNAKLRLTVDSVRVLGTNAAIEEGQSYVDPAPVGAVGIHKYTAVYVKADGKWRMVSLRDTWEESPDENVNLADLEFLIGKWVAEEHGARSESDCRWIADKKFVERQYTTRHADGTTASGLQIIGWDAQSNSIRSWNFSPDGSHATGLWSPIEDGWRAEIQGTTSDGAPTSTVNILMKLDDNAYSWQSVQRQIGGQALPDTGEIVIKRQRPVTAKK
jgi:uncharacterized protein (TIGR02246 family)